MIEITVPKKVDEIISRLTENGFEAYAVGGCVRDSILNRKPDDWDITTSAKPQEVKALFLHTIDTGIKHGTVTVMMEKEGFEVTTYRLDGTYSDGRHPDSIEFTASLTEDLRRRDFTINAMAYSNKRGLIDVFGGLRDLQSKTVRSVGNPYERFGEDALRMLRAIRFSGQLGFQIEKDTYAAISELSDTIAKVSVERIAKELEKLLVSPGAEKLLLVYESGIMRYTMPELDLFFERQIGKAVSCIEKMKKAAFSYEKGLFMLRLGLLLEDFGGEKAKKILKNLKLDNETLDTVKKLVDVMKIPTETNRKEMRETVRRAGKSLMPLFFAARRASELPTNENYFEEILKYNEATALSDLMINGNDLIELGIPKGKAVGAELNRLLALVIEDPALNQKERLIEEVKAYEKQ